MMDKFCMNCSRHLPRNKNARYRWRGSEFCSPRCKEKFIKEDKEVGDKYYQKNPKEKMMR